MNFSQHPDDIEDPFHGTPQQEAHKEMIQIFGSERPEAEWILTDYDVWEKNPYFTGVPSGRHPEDDRDDENNLDIYKNTATIVPMKNTLHFAKVTEVSPESVGQVKDSGNGYYSYAYYNLPYTGFVNNDNEKTVYRILHEKYYQPPFMSFGGLLSVTPNDTNTGGNIVFRTTYHHGD